MIQFGEALPRIRKRVDADLRHHGLPREKREGGCALELTIRIGNEEYARLNRSFGLTTLRNRHVSVTGTTIRFKFRGKSGKVHEVGLRDRRLASVIRGVQEMPGQELFEYVDADGTIQAIESDDVNAYLREVSGSDFTAKDFRTWAGTVLAFRALSLLPPVDSDADGKGNVVAAIKAVAEELRNTPAVCRRSYVHPGVIEAYLEGSLLHRLRRPVSPQDSQSGLDPSAEAVAVPLSVRRRDSLPPRAERTAAPGPTPRTTWRSSSRSSRSSASKSAGS